jgi:hypothetical protein
VVVVVDEVSEQCIVIYHTARHNYTRDLPVAVVVEVVSKDCISLCFEVQVD